MPPKETNLPEMYVLQPDGTKMRLGEIQNAEIISDDDYDFSEKYIIQPTQTATFEVRWNPTIDTIHLIHLLIYGKLPTNNWRKMHGFPLRRKQKKRK